MSNIDSSFRSPFFPGNKNDSKSISSRRTGEASALQRNSYERAQQLNNKTGRDAKVEIPDAVRDFSRIKKAVDAAPEIDNTDKIASLKSRIQAGTYEVDYDALADNILANEF
jgi:negative regulator of flagellin synthesis FlgM